MTRSNVAELFRSYLRIHPVYYIASFKATPTSSITPTATTLIIWSLDNPTDNNPYYDFDLLVIGAGSGGIATARRAPTYILWRHRGHH